MSQDSVKSVQHTPLTSRHIDAGAKMIPFAGWLMPVQYSGILNEHRTVREAAGLFDLGHMGQFHLAGPEAEAFLQFTTSNDIARIEPGGAQYGLITTPTAGVVDDIIVYRLADEKAFMVVVNAANLTKDFEWFDQIRKEHFPEGVTLEDQSAITGMIAIQGPKAEAIMQDLVSIDLNELGNFSIQTASLNDVDVLLARTGYTGEDGFEVYSSADEAGAIWDAIMEAGRPKGLIPVGLGARDTLRLEARMPLYGNELSTEITPLEAGLSWAVKLDKGDFVGREVLARQKEDGIPRKTVGFKLTERSGAARSDAVVQVDGQTVGYVTSGAFSPTLEENIGLALIERGAAGIGKPLSILIRDKPVEAIQVKLPFYKRNS